MSQEDIIDCIAEGMASFSGNKWAVMTSSAKSLVLLTERLADPEYKASEKEVASIERAVVTILKSLHTSLACHQDEKMDGFYFLGCFVSETEPSQLYLGANAGNLDDAIRIVQEKIDKRKGAGHTYRLRQMTRTNRATEEREVWRFA